MKSYIPLVSYCQFRNWYCIRKKINRVHPYSREPGKPGDLNLICPGPEIAFNLSQNVRKPRQNKKFSIKPGMLRYAKLQYYIQTNFSTFCAPANLECLWCLPFGAKIVYTITWPISYLTWTKAEDNLEFYD